MPRSDRKTADFFVVQAHKQCTHIGRIERDREGGGTLCFGCAVMAAEAYARYYRDFKGEKSEKGEIVITPRQAGHAGPPGSRDLPMTKSPGGEIQIGLDETFGQGCG